MSSISDLIKDKRYDDLFILSRFMYRIGKPLIEDSKYDKMESSYRRQGKLIDYTERSYDDDPIPFKLLQELEMSELIPSMKEVSKYTEYLEVEKSLSIRAVRSDEEVWEFIKMHKGKDLIVSLKMDGANCKTLYRKGNLELSLSRGRSSGCFDYTKGAYNVLPNKLETNEEIVKVFTESFVLQDNLEYLRCKYNEERYKVPKGSAISMMRVEHEKEDYKYLKSVAIDIETDKGFKSVEDKFLTLKEFGFEVPYYKVIPYTEIPESFEGVKEFVYRLCDEVYRGKIDYPSDGLVMEVNEINDGININNQYSDKNIAIKYNHWEPDCFVGVVKGVIVEQKRVEASVRLEIQPLRTSDGCSARFVNGYNPDIIIKNNIKVGTEIIFERNANTVNVLKYKE